MNQTCNDCGNPNRYADACKTCRDRPSLQPKPAAVQAQEATKAASQSARDFDDLALETWEDIANDRTYSARTRLEKAFAAQRQAGREEAMRTIIENSGDVKELCAKCELTKRYAVVVEALEKIRDWKPGITYGGRVFDAHEIARKALSALDKGATHE